MLVKEGILIGKIKWGLKMDEYFKTSDLYFASFLIASGITFKGTEKKNDRNKIKTVFILDDNKDEVSKLATGFYSGNADVNVTKFTSTLKNLKSLCFKS